MDVHRGEVVCIIGASGSGKSTFLRCLNGLETFDAGELLIDGEPLDLVLRGGRYHELSPREIAIRRRSVGMVFQQFNLFPHLNVLENITVAPVVTGLLSRRAAIEKATELLGQVGLQHRAATMPSQLSGGQQQRVAIARALAMSPKLMLFDEPTSALDPELVEEVLNVIRQLARAGMTMVVVTHEMAFAEDVADRVVLIDEGKILQQGSPADVLRNPQSERAKGFLARLNRG
jgi:polar amino acid transport system ATP-binding protein